MSLAQITKDMNDFVTSKGWYAEDSKRPQTPRNLAISLSIEAAELLEHVQWRDQPRDAAAFADELADVLLYTLQIAHVLGIDLEAATQKKLAVNHGRTWDADGE
jgi:NTP pyrophosphatase (non-canonical NTP hydrolase)